MERQAEIFKIMGTSLRLSILKAIYNSPEGKLQPVELINVLNLKPISASPVISRELRILRDYNILDRFSRGIGGNITFYSIKDDLVKRILDLL